MSESESASYANLFKGLPLDTEAWLKMLQQLRERLTGLSSGSNLGFDLGMFRETLDSMIQQFKEMASMGGNLPTDPSAWMKFMEEKLGDVTGGKDLSSLMDPTAFMTNLQKLMQNGMGSLSSENQMPQMADLFNPSYWLKASEQGLRQTADLISSFQTKKE